MIIVFVIISCILIPIMYLYLGLQLIALGDFVKSGLDVNHLHFVTDPRRYLEYKEYMYLILFLIALIQLFLLEFLYYVLGTFYIVMYLYFLLAYF